MTQLDCLFIYCHIFCCRVLSSLACSNKIKNYNEGSIILVVNKQVLEFLATIAAKKGLSTEKRGGMHISIICIPEMTI